MHLRRLAAAALATTLGVAIVPGPAVAGATTAPAAGRHTTSVHVRPVDGTGHLRSGYRVTGHHGRASCLLGGIAVGSAYRCFTGDHFIFDPCWVQAGGTHHVLCLVTPWRHSVVRLHVTRGFTGSARPELPRHPWGIQLADGTRCVGSQGASGTVHGRGVSYRCLDDATLLLEDPDTSGARWRIRVARYETGGAGPVSVGFEPIDSTYVGRPSLRP